MVPRLAASTSPGSLWETQILCPIRSPESDWARPHKLSQQAVRVMLMHIQVLEPLVEILVILVDIYLKLQFLCLEIFINGFMIHT